MCMFFCIHLHNVKDEKWISRAFPLRWHRKLCRYCDFRQCFHSDNRNRQPLEKCFIYHCGTLPLHGLNSKIHLRPELFPPLIFTEMASNPLLFPKPLSQFFSSVFVPNFPHFS